MSTPYIGSKICLISKSEIRYEGILYTIDPKESTIALAKVSSEEWGILLTTDIKDLTVSETPQLAPQILHTGAGGGLPSDPAILSASKESTAGQRSNENVSSPDGQKASNTLKTESASVQTNQQKKSGHEQKARKNQSKRDRRTSSNAGAQNATVGDENAGGAALTTPTSQRRSSRSRRRGTAETGRRGAEQQQQQRKNDAAAVASDLENADDRRNSAEERRATSESTQNGNNGEKSRHKRSYRRNQYRRDYGYNRRMQQENWRGSGSPVRRGGMRGGGYRGGPPYRRFNVMNDFYDMDGFSGLPNGFIGNGFVPFGRGPPPLMPFVYRGSPIRQNYRSYQYPRQNRMNKGLASGDQDQKNAREPTVKFDVDYDFERANEEFLKEKMAKMAIGDGGDGVDRQEAIGANGQESAAEGERDKVVLSGGNVLSADEPESKDTEMSVQPVKEYYNKNRSFFDNISCEALERSDPNNASGNAAVNNFGGGHTSSGRDHRNVSSNTIYPRIHWRRERELNQQTFGHAAFARNASSSSHFFMPPPPHNFATSRGSYRPIDYYHRPHPPFMYHAGGGYGGVRSGYVPRGGYVRG
uniref:Uncharacterized protein n=1 Tax=Romanomermis culicivorax TaxID=13658 RepID=A0A915KC89_ROMCU